MKFCGVVLFCGVDLLRCFHGFDRLFFLSAIVICCFVMTGSSASFLVLQDEILDRNGTCTFITQGISQFFSSNIVFVHFVGHNTKSLPVIM